jgi:hypothetical protein
LAFFGCQADPFDLLAFSLARAALSIFIGKSKDRCHRDRHFFAIADPGYFYPQVEPHPTDYGAFIKILPLEQIVTCIAIFFRLD